MSNIRGVHVLAEFPCPRCGGPAVSLAIASVQPDGRLVDPTEHAGGRQICSACRQTDKAEAEREYQKRRDQTAWKRKASLIGRPIPNRPRPSPPPAPPPKPKGTA